MIRSIRQHRGTVLLISGFLFLFFSSGLAQSDDQSLLSELRAARRAGDMETYAKLEAQIPKALQQNDETPSVYFMKSGAVGGPGDPRVKDPSGKSFAASQSNRGIFGPDIHVRGSNMTTYELNQSMATDSSGNIYVAFQTDLSSTGYFYIQLYWSADGGINWNSYGYVLASNTDLLNPSLAIGEGSNPTLMVAYIVDDGIAVPYPEVATATLGSSSFTTHSVPLWAGGEGWSKPVLSNDSLHFSGWFAYLACERVVDSASENINVDFWRSTDYGVSWGTQPTVICGYYDSEAWIDPDISYGSPTHQRIFAICYNKDQQALYKVTSDDFGGSFTTETLLHNLYSDPTYPVDPEVAISPDKSTVMIACTYRSGAGDDNIGYKYSYDGGEYWSTFLTLNGVTSNHEFGATLHASEGGQSWHLAYTSQSYVYYNVRPQDNSGLWKLTPLEVSDTGDASHSYYKKGLTSNWTTDRPGIAWADYRDGLPDYDTYFDTEYISDVYVPDDYPTIQAAIDAALEGFTIHVKPNTYYENVDFKGKNVTVVSTNGPNVTVIDGGSAGSVVSFTNMNQPATVLDGFTITNGNATQGGGIYCAEFASPTIKNNIVKDNTATNGGGMRCEKFQSVVTGCIFEDNYASSSGGGIWCSTLNTTLSEFSNNYIRNNSAGAAFGGGGGIYSLDGSPKLVNNMIVHNSASNGGGFMVVEYGIELINNTIADNSAWTQGGGIYLSWCTGPIRNTIVYGNTAPSDPQIYYWNTAPTVDHCDVEGGWTGVNNIDKDPLFVNPAGDNFHLTWLSPCINMGTAYTAPPDDIDGHSRPQAGSVDLGADEFFGTHLLAADAYAFDEDLGCNIIFKLAAGPGNGGRQYVILGGVTGKVPGIPLPGGLTELPVHYDAFTGLVMDNLNGPLFQNFLAFLDGAGQSQATLFLPPVPGSAGVTMSFAYALEGPPWDFASHPIDIVILP